MADPQIPQYNPTQAPFKFNAYYDLNQANEANTFDNIMCEANNLYGHDLIYIEREVGTAEPIFGEYLASRLTTGTPIRMFLEETTGWAGNATDMYAKFNLQVTDEATFHCPITTFCRAKDDIYIQETGLPASGFPASGYALGEFFPKVGDLIYFLKGRKLFEVLHIENEATPGFYSFGNRNAYVFKCKTYTFDHMEVMEDSSIPLEVQGLNLLAAQDETNMNDVIDNTIISSGIISHDEVDPITGR
jgi:hypothetical protein